MNNQNILRKGRTKFDIVLDYSELYDYILVDDIFGKVDIVLDYSEFYDYALGDNVLDYIYIETTITTLTGKFLITEDNYLFVTEDNYILEYQ